MIADSLFRFSLPYSWNSRVEGKVGGLRGLSQLPRRRVGDLLAPVAYVDVDRPVAPTLGDKKEGMDRSHSPRVVQGGEVL